MKNTPKSNFFGGKNCLTQSTVLPKTRQFDCMLRQTGPLNKKNCIADAGVGRGTARIIASQLFKSLASTLARISQQMMLRQKSPLAPAIDQIKSLALWSKLWSKPNEASL